MRGLEKAEDGRGKEKKGKRGRATVRIGLGVQSIKNLIKRAKPLR
jgi:hypothetical protein